jgi:RNA polymerase sigma-70 factor (ECF subfamily)
VTATKSISAAVHSAVSDLLAELHARAGCEKLGITREVFAQILCDVSTKYLSPESSQPEVRTFLQTLRIDELALARGCAAGNNSAWEIFLTRYREKLYQAALRIAREDSAARDLADSLYAELYGTSTRQGERVSKLASFTGRGSLEGWLRTVLAQEFVNRYRRTKRLVSLDEEGEDGSQFAAPEPEPVLAADSRLESATNAALAALAAEDRMVLAAYYLDGRTLAEIARMLGVHESTISRKVDKLAKQLRKKILSGMMQQGMARRQAEEALEVDVRDLRLDIRRSLAQESSVPAFSNQRVENAAGGSEIPDDLPRDVEPSPVKSLKNQGLQNEGLENKLGGRN